MILTILGVLGIAVVYLVIIGICMDSKAREEFYAKFND